MAATTNELIEVILDDLANLKEQVDGDIPKLAMTTALLQVKETVLKNGYYYERIDK
jgi:hypothetical protein